MCLILYRSLPWDDGVVVSTPDFQTVRMPGWYVPQHMDFLAVKFGILQLVYKPLELFDRIRAVYQQPPIFVVAVIHVQRNYAKSRADQYAVERAAFDGSACGTW